MPKFRLNDFPFSEYFTLSTKMAFLGSFLKLKSILLPVVSSIPTEKLSFLFAPAPQRNCSVEVNLTFGPSRSKAPGSYPASSVCLSIKTGCIILDLPELLAPASKVKGLISILCSSRIDLKHPTVIALILSSSFGLLLTIFSFGIWYHLAKQIFLLTENYHI